MADIEMGPGATDRDSNTDSHGYTMLMKTNPALASGTLSSFSAWFFGAATGVKVGTFYLVSGTTWKCRAAQAIGDVDAGSKKDFVVSLAVETDDILGFYCATGISETAAGGDGTMYLAGDHCVADDESIYSTGGAYLYSIYAEGAISVGAICITSAADAITDEGADLHGSSQNLSESLYATRRGFVWGTVDGGPYPNDWHEDDTYDEDMEWEHTLTGCDPGVPIYYKAYMVTSEEVF